MRKLTSKAAIAVFVLTAYAAIISFGLKDDDKSNALKYAAARNDPKVASVQAIWSGAPHNAFTTLVQYKDEWYCAFREATAHTTWDGKIRVIHSKDGKAWESIYLFEMKGLDLRDPRLCVTPNNRLMILYGSQYNDSATRRPVYRPMVSFTRNGKEWRDPEFTNIKGDWAYDITWSRKRAYTASYNPKGACKLYQSKDGIQYALLTELKLPGGTNEIAIAAMDDEKLVAIARCDSNMKAYYGESKRPYKEWTFKELPFFMAGPKMLILPDKTVFAGGRSFINGQSTTILTRSLGGNELTSILNLPSGGDTSYPGLVWVDNVLWMSYYSTHEGKCQIYLAKIEFPLKPVEGPK